MSNESNDSALQQRFHAFRRALIGERPDAFDRDRDDLTLDAIATMAQMLRAGNADDRTIGLIVNFLESLQDDAKVSVAKREWALKIARRLLCFEPNKNTGKAVEEQRAIATFVAHMEGGASEEAALIAAYDAFFASQGRSFEGDRRKGGQRVEKGAQVIEVTVADRSMNDLKAKLRRADVLERRPPGRKKGPA